MVTFKKAIHFPPNTGKSVHFPITTYSKLHFKTSSNKQFFPSIPHTHFSSKFNRTFSFIKLLTTNDNEQSMCSTLIQNHSSHPAHTSERKYWIQ